MQKIARLQLRKYRPHEIEPLIKTALAAMLAVVNPNEIYLFGSGLSESFDDASDLDFLVVFKSLADATEGQKKLYRIHPLTDRSIDFVCVDWETFRKKCDVGGVCFEAAQHGRLLFPDIDPTSKADCNMWHPVRAGEPDDGTQCRSDKVIQQAISQGR